MKNFDVLSLSNVRKIVNAQLPGDYSLDNIDADFGEGHIHLIISRSTTKREDDAPPSKQAAVNGANKESSILESMRLRSSLSSVDKQDHDAVCAVLSVMKDVSTQWCVVSQPSSYAIIFDKITRPLSWNTLLCMLPISSTLDFDSKTLRSVVPKSKPELTL
jgi:hypothetical protein